MNRICPLLSFGLRGVTLFNFDMSDKICTLWTRFDFAITVLALYLAEVVLVVRVYNLYSHHRTSQWLIVLFSLAAGVVALILMINKLNLITITPNIPISFHRVTAGCLPTIPTEFWSVFVPIFLSETFLYVLTLFRVRASLARGGSAHPLVRCLVMDGTAFYLALLSSVAISLVGSTSETVPQFSIGALLSNSIVAGCSIAASRLILSIRSLAARLKYDPDCVFNHLELARIYGNGVGKVRRDGQFGTKIIVEVGDTGMELQDLSPTDGKCSIASTSRTVTVEDVISEPPTLGPWRAQLR